MIGKQRIFSLVLVATFFVSSSSVFAFQRANQFYIAPTALLADPSSASGGSVQGSYAFINNIFNLDNLSMTVESAVMGDTDLSKSNFVTPALLIGYQVTSRLSIETVIAPPDPLKLHVNYAGGEVAMSELGGLVPAELLPFLPETMAIPAVRGEIGEIKVIGAIFNANYKFQLTPRIRPYLGVGILYFDVLDVDLENLSLVDFSESSLEIDASLGYFFLVGLDYQISDHWSFVFDAKALTLDAEISFRDMKIVGEGIPETVIPELDIEMKLGGVIYQAGIKWAF
ncbi:MAG: hypothetical protein COB51_03095 [Moraxellaceae bacterium]|nr:MAG: hypothetical protein COB51_03095 [Moraxellaceae bacterium]